MFDRIKKLQSHLVELGVARNVLALPASETLPHEDYTSDDKAANIAFTEVVVEEEIVSVSRDLFSDGYYDQAVLEAFKAVDNFVRGKSGYSGKPGTPMMENVFSPNKPKLVWSGRKNVSKKSKNNEQVGYMGLFAGAMMGIRNPLAHETGWVEDSDVALELLVFAQHLMRKAKSCHPPVYPRRKQ
ncbi:MAG: TIGR02391 family protein [Rhodobacteraceae bacterium]|nr:TIGR02391 family protein [Paracoccaceae bacterium]